MPKIQKRLNAESRFNTTESGVFWSLLENRAGFVRLEIYPTRSLHNEKDAEDARRELKSKFSDLEKKIIIFTTWTRTVKGNLI